MTVPPVLLTPEQRVALLEIAVARSASKKQLGQALGYKDGGLIQQMLKGKRPVTEKTLLALSRVRWLNGLLEEFAHGHPHRTQEPAPSYEVFSHPIQATLKELGSALAALSPDQREAAAVLLAGWAREGGRDHWRSLLTQLLEQPQKKAGAGG